MCQAFFVVFCNIQYNKKLIYYSVAASSKSVRSKSTLNPWVEIEWSACTYKLVGHVSSYNQKYLYLYNYNGLYW